MRYELLQIASRKLHCAVTRFWPILASLIVVRMDRVGKGKVKFDWTFLIHVLLRCYSIEKFLRLNPLLKATTCL